MRHRPRAAKPDRFRVRRLPRATPTADGSPYRSAAVAAGRDDLVIEWNARDGWSAGTILVMTALWGAWLGFVVLWWRGLLSLAPPESALPAVAVHVGVGAGWLWSGYLLLALWLWRVRVALVGNELRIESYDPAPLRRRVHQRLPIDGVRRFDVTSSDISAPSGTDGVPYRLTAVGPAGTAHVVVPLADREELAFLAQALEDELGIGDDASAPRTRG